MENYKVLHAQYLHIETGTGYLQSFTTSHSQGVTQGIGKLFRIIQLIIRTQQKVSSVQSKLFHLTLWRTLEKETCGGYITDLATVALRKFAKRKPSLATATLQYRYCHCAGTGEGKAVPLQAWSGPEGSRKLRFPYFMTTAQDGGKVVRFTHRPPLPPRKCYWYSFLLEADSTPGP